VPSSSDGLAGPGDGAATLIPMAKQSKKPADLNRLAAAIVGDSTDETPQEPESRRATAGRLGGEKGGQVRASRMSAEERSEAARKAARARWESKT
jgi:hypothetical protein